MIKEQIAKLYGRINRAFEFDLTEGEDEALNAWIETLDTIDELVKVDGLTSNGELWATQKFIECSQYIDELKENQQ